MTKYIFVTFDPKKKDFYLGDCLKSPIRTISGDIIRFDLSENAAQYRDLICKNNPHKYKNSYL